MARDQSFLERHNQMNWPRAENWNQRCLRIGHGGAAGHAPANSLGSLALALEMGVDMVEFDVRPCRDALVLVHDETLAGLDGNPVLVGEQTLTELGGLVPDPERQVATLGEALDLLKGRSLINVDLKAAGTEQEVVEMVHTRGMSADVLYSSLYPASLQRVRQADGGAITGLSYPEDRANVSGKPSLKPLVDTALALMRFWLPYRILGMMTGARANAMMLYHRVTSPLVVRTVHWAGGRVFTWTVDTPERMRTLRGWGVDGIASNRPEFFAGLD